jgi:GxxExxY protein
MSLPGAGAESYTLSEPSHIASRVQLVQLQKAYTIDLIIDESVIVEIETVDKLLPIHSSQLITYMRLSRVTSGLLLNFNVELLPHGIKRVLL